MLDRVTFALRALRGRNLRLFFAGQAISQVGSWMQRLAMAWLVYRLTGSTVVLGVMAMAGQLPSVFMAPLAGAIADRWSRYRLVFLAQVLMMIQATILAVLVIADWVEVWHLIALAFAQGILVGMDIPARQALHVRLVASPEDLPNAIALNSSMFNAARLIGPAIAGVLIGLIGEGPVFVVNAVSYIAVLWALWGIDPGEERPATEGSVLRSLQQGLEYAIAFAPIGGALLLLAGVSMVGIPYVVLLPVFADEVLGGDAGTLGILTSCSGLGALIAGLQLASRSSVLGLGRLVVGSTTGFGFGLVLFSLSRSVWISSVLLVGIGYGLLITTASINTVLQTLVDEDKRGRVMSLYTVAFIGASAVGSFTGGWLAARLGAPLTVAIGGAASMTMGVMFARRLPALRAMVHPAYVRLGILPEVATGVAQPSEFRPKV